MSLVENADRDRRDSPRARVKGVTVRPRWFWPVLVAGTYAAGGLAVALAEYVSEMAKIGRGTFTDSFSPFLFTDLLTLPTSAVHRHPVDYPATFSSSVFRHLVREAVLPALVNVAVQAMAITVIALVCGALWRRRRAAA
jgi:hypothetical protein